jgi:3-deoxy-D-manno-octulosonic-acid transferase
VSGRLSVPLRAYRTLSAMATPFTPLFLARRLQRGKEHRLRLPERRGISTVARPAGPLVWVHGASVGELLSVLPLVERIRARELNVLVTSGTVTSSGLMEQRLPRGVIHQFVPLDVPMYVRRFLEHWQPDLALFVESELWPNILIETSTRGVPMIMVNGRMSENSFKRWRYLPKTIVGLLTRLDLCLTRSAADADRFGALGALHVVTAGDLKLDGPAPPADTTKLTALQKAIAGRPLIAAASTHAGEEAAVIDAHQRLRGNFPGLLSLIVPRHPERGAGVVEIVRAVGLKTKLRSRGELPDAATDIYVMDTMGELGLVYRLAPVVFVGGSLVKHGGQNPIEPAKLGAAILHGPYVWNFAEIYGALDRARGAELVSESSKLTAAFGALIAQPAACVTVADAARATVEGLSGGLERTLQSLDPYLMQLRLRQRAGHA